MQLYHLQLLSFLHVFQAETKKLNPLHLTCMPPGSKSRFGSVGRVPPRWRWLLTHPGATPVFCVISQRANPVSAHSVTLTKHQKNPVDEEIPGGVQCPDDVTPILVEKQ